MNRIQEILNILNVFLPYEICLQIIYKYNGFISPTCLIIKPFHTKCKNFINLQFYNENNKSSIFVLKQLEICNISPRLSKIQEKYNNKWISYIYRKRFPIIITCYIIFTLRTRNRKIISKNIIKFKHNF